jgi:hypothetical protein
MSTHRALVFAGAGASRSVSDKKYPTTLQFFQRLPDEIANHDLFRMLIVYLQEMSGADTQIDIEQVLWAADELLAVLKTFNNSKHPFGWSARSYLSRALGAPGADLFANTIPLAASAEARLEALTGKINEQIYALYGTVPEQSELESNWVSLMQALINRGYAPDVFTTNYDCVIEEVLRVLDVKGIAHSIATGRGTETIRRLHLNPWIEALAREQLPSRTLMTKLHGSVDWSKDNGEIYLGPARFLGRHDAHVVIYPGYKSTPTENPFAIFHSYLKRSWNESSIAVFVGFAFRDEYINGLLESAPRPDRRIVIIDPSEKVSHPFSKSQVKHIRRPFDEEAVSEIFSGSA